jgi:predicted permease
LREKAGLVVYILLIQIEIILIVTVGYFITKKGIMGAGTRKDLTDIVIYVVLPCNIFNSFNIDMTFELLRNCALVFIIAFCVQLAYIILNKLLYGKFPMTKRVVMQYATICNNAGFMGLPVIESVFGPTGVLYGSIVLIPMRLFMWTAGLSLFTKTDRKDAFKRLATHPCIWAVILGFGYMFLPFELPGFLTGALTAIGGCTTALSMLIVGSILSEINLRDVFDKACFYFSFIRLIAIPAVLYLTLRLLYVPSLVTGVSVLSSAMPAAMITAMLAQKYGQDAAFASKMLFVSTVLSLLTLPLVAFILKMN